MADPAGVGGAKSIGPDLRCRELSLSIMARRPTGVFCVPEGGWRLSRPPPSWSAERGWRVTCATVGEALRGGVGEVPGREILSRSLRARGRSRNGEPGRVPLVGEASRCVTGRGVRVIKACRTSRPNGCPGLQGRTGTDASDARTSVRRGSFCLGGTTETCGSATRPVAGVPSPLKNPLKNGAPGMNVGRV